MARRRGNNEGSITRRKDKLWQGAVIVGYNADGKSVRKFYYGKTRKEVQEKINDATNRVKNGTYTEPSKLTLGEWIRNWLDNYMKHSLRPTTWESYDEQFRNHISPALGVKRLTQVRTSDLQTLYTAKLEGRRLDSKAGGLSATSVRYIHRIIHNSLEQAKREGLIAINPANAVRLPKQEQPEIQSLDTAGVGTLLAAAKESRHYPAFLLALASGVRRGELLALRWQDINFDAGTINITRGLVRTKQGLLFQEPKTKLSKRTISIPPDVMAELKAHKRRQAAEILAWGEHYKKNDLAFACEDGNIIDPQNFVRHFKGILKKAGLPHIKFHALRHTYAVLSLQEGVSIKTLQENLGHHKASFTLDVYGGVTAKMKQEATDKIGALLASCLSE